jgi:LAO/AO transport system kinase
LSAPGRAAAAKAAPKPNDRPTASAAPAAEAVGSLAAEILKGSPKAVARAMSLVENGAPESEALLDAVFGKRPAAPRVGVTGPPGAGKSTLVAEYARLLRAKEIQVGVVAVDPTSPFTGGAILGDRVRMGEHATDPLVFIRSMATRGSLGGLAARTGDLCEILDAWGSMTTLIETVGVGQSELDVAEAADTVAVVLTPESGDAIQALKAGLMEIADVIVLNKADHAGADAMEAALRSSLAFRPSGSWRPPIVRTIATERKGIEAMHEALLKHREHIASPAIATEIRRAKTRLRLRNAVREGLWNTWLSGPAFEQALESAADRVLRGEVSPHRAARDLTERIARHGQRQD